MCLVNYSKVIDNPAEDQTLESLARILQEIDPSLSYLTQVILTPNDDDIKKTFADCFSLNLDTDNIAEEAIR
jgi:hypothetical protein